jgi:hypothetical protein
MATEQGERAADAAFVAELGLADARARVHQAQRSLWEAESAYREALGAAEPIVVRFQPFVDVYVHAETQHPNFGHQLIIADGAEAKVSVDRPFVRPYGISFVIADGERGSDCFRRIEVKVPTIPWGDGSD